MRLVWSRLTTTLGIFLLQSTPFTADNSLAQSHARGFLLNLTTPEIPQDNPNGTPGILPLAMKFNLPLISVK